MPDHCFNTLAKSVYSFFWVLYIFFLMQGAYKCNLRTYMMIKDYEPLVKTAEVWGQLLNKLSVKTLIYLLARIWQKMPMRGSCTFLKEAPTLDCFRNPQMQVYKFLKLESNGFKYHLFSAERYLE